MRCATLSKEPQLLYSRQDHDQDVSSRAARPDAGAGLRCFIKVACPEVQTGRLHVRLREEAELLEKSQVQVSLRLGDAGLGLTLLLGAADDRSITSCAGARLATHRPRLEAAIAAGAAVNALQASIADDRSRSARSPPRSAARRALRLAREPPCVAFRWLTTG